jgi:hypothetical protein
MSGDFEVEPRDASTSTIRIRFTFTARGGWLAQALHGVTFCRAVFVHLRPARMPM